VRKIEVFRHSGTNLSNPEKLGATAPDTWSCGHHEWNGRLLLQASARLVILRAAKKPLLLIAPESQKLVHLERGRSPPHVPRRIRCACPHRGIAWPKSRTRAKDRQYDELYMNFVNKSFRIFDVFFMYSLRYLG
jgi:hypothetical protein